MGSPNENGYWSGMLGMVSRGEANMSINTAYQTQLRGEVVNYMNPNGHSKVAVLIPKQQGGLQADTVFLPFSYYTWALIFASLGLVSGLGIIMVFFDQRFISTEKKPKGSFIKELVNALEEFISAPIHHGHEVKTTAPYRHLLVGWRFTMLVVGMMYGEALYAFFVRPPSQTIPFNDVTGFANALLETQYQLMVPAGIHQFMKAVLATSTVPGMLKLKEAFETVDIKEIPNEDRFGGPTYMQADTAFLDIDMVQSMMVARNCAVTVIELKDIEGNFYAPVFTKSFPYIEQFNLFTDMQMDYYKRLEYTYGVSETPAPCTYASGINLINLNLGHLWMTFQICAMGLFISSVIFGIQHLHHRKAGTFAVKRLEDTVGRGPLVSNQISGIKAAVRTLLNETNDVDVHIHGEDKAKESRSITPLYSIGHVLPPRSQQLRLRPISSKKSLVPGVPGSQSPGPGPGPEQVLSLTESLKGSVTGSFKESLSGSQAGLYKEYKNINDDIEDV